MTSAPLSSAAGLIVGCLIVIGYWKIREWRERRKHTKELKDYPWRDIYGPKTW